MEHILSARKMSGGNSEFVRKMSQGNGEFVRKMSFNK